MNKSFKSKLLALSLTTAITLAGGAVAADFNFGSQIVDASDKGNISEVQALINQGANPNETGEFNTTALMRAAYNGNNQLAVLLLNNRANPNMVDIGGASALLVASRENHRDVVSTLIKAGADVNLANNDGYTPLAIANSKNNGEIASLLNEAGGKLESTIKIAANNDLKPASGKKKLSKSIVDVDTADINIDFSNGRLGNGDAVKPIQTAKAQTPKEILSVASFQLADKIEIPEKPTSAKPTTNWLKTMLENTKSYKLSADEMMVNNNQNSILDLGTFKSQEFANNKIGDLKRDFGDALNGVELKVVPKTTGPITSYQVNGGIISRSKAGDICSKLITGGTNCRIQDSSFASQTAFSQYKGDAPAPAAAKVDRQDVLGPAKSPDVASQPLPSIVDANKPQTKAVTTNSTTPENKTVAANTTLVAAQSKPPIVVADSPPPTPKTNTITAAKSDNQPLPLPLPPAPSDVAPPAPAANTSYSHINDMKNMLNGKDFASNTASQPKVIQSQAAPLTPRDEVFTMPVTPPTQTAANAQPQPPVQAAAANPQPNIVPTKTTVITSPSPAPLGRSSNVQPAITTPNTLVAPPIAPVNKPQEVTTAARPQELTTTPLATQIKPQQVAAANSPISTLPADGYVAPTPYPTIVVRSAKAKTNPTPVYNPPQQNFAAAIPPVAQVTSTPIVTAQKTTAPMPMPLNKKQSANKFEVARPVKVTNDQPDYTDNSSFEMPVSTSNSSREIWAKIDYFTDERAARYYINSLKMQDSSLNNYRTRTTKPLSGGRASAQIGPFESDDAAAKVCNVVYAQNQGYRCYTTETFTASHGYQGGGEGAMRHSSLYGSESPMAYERHSGGY